MDGLRGIAVIMVASFHMHGLGLVSDSLNLGGFFLDVPSRLTDVGFLGIDLFFFLSGFALFYPYAQHLFEERPLQSLQTYAHRRASKILPSYFAALTILALVYPLWLEPPDSLFMHWLKHAFFMHNFWHGSTMSISGPFWTLAVEVQFYVLFPLMAHFLMRAPVCTTALLCILASAYRIHLQLTGVAYLGPGYQLPAYLDLFILGSFTSRIIVGHRSKNQSLSPAESSLWTAVTYASAIALYALLCTCERSDHGIWHTDFAGILGIVLLVMCVGIARTFSVLRRILESPILIWFSGISYNIYLWHVSILMWCRAHPLHWIQTMPNADTLNTLFICSIILGIAWMATEWIERPIVRAGLFSPFGIDHRKDS
jgi:peptidoglycan/LPS O-acetylase OafA/YrhL